MSAEPAALRIAVHGEVQGVNFRAAAARRGEELGLSGWVANQPDGTVAIHAEGPLEALDALVAWADEGPGPARVEHLDAAEAQPEGIEGFGVRG